MTQTAPYRPRWEAWPKNDRLKRWCVVDAAAPGTGKPVIADNIRQESQARRIAASLDMLDALRAARGVLVNVCGSDLQSEIISEQMKLIDSALAKAEVAA